MDWESSPGIANTPWDNSKVCLCSASSLAPTGAEGSPPLSQEDAETWEQTRHKQHPHTSISCLQLDTRFHQSLFLSITRGKSSQAECSL